MASGLDCQDCYLEPRDNWWGSLLTLIESNGIYLIFRNCVD